jgi:predicted N-acetyltransferase YhbS
MDCRGIELDYLANHREAIPLIAQWMFEQWPQYLAGKTLSDVTTGIEERASFQRLPVAWVAIDSGTTVGTICLKQHDLDDRMDLSPWLGGLYVAASHRRRGIGEMLMNALLKEAIRLGYKHLYLWTPSSESYYAKRGWALMQRRLYKATPISLLEKYLCAKGGRPNRKPSKNG